MPQGYIDDAPKAAAPAYIDDAPKTPDFVDDAPVAMPKPTAGHTGYGNMMDSIAKKVGVDNYAIRALHATEDNSDNPKAISDHGAVGMMQMEPGTFKQYSDAGADITNPKDNFTAGARYYKHLLAKYNGDSDKAFQAYNLGEGSFDSGQTAKEYAAQVESNYAFLRKQIGGAEPKKAPLSRGTRKASAPTPTNAADKPFKSSWVDDADHAAGGIAKVANDMPSTIAKTAVVGVRDVFTGRNGPVGLSTAEQDKYYTSEYEKLRAFGPVATAEHGAQFLGNIAGLPIPYLNAVMRDAASGNLEAEGSIATNLLHALQDPGNAGHFLDVISQKFAAGGREEHLFWDTKPGFRDAIAQATPSTPMGQQMQIVSGLHADISRFMASHQGMNDLMSAAEYFFSPGNHLPNIMLKGPKAVGGMAAKAGRATVDTVSPFAVNTKVGASVINNAQRASDMGKTAATWIKSTVPIIGDRYHRTLVTAGPKAADAHWDLVTKIVRAPEMVQRIFKQEHMYGGTSVQDAQKIWRESEMWNPHIITSIAHPGGVGDPVFDPITKSMVGKPGGVTGKDHDNHAYVMNTEKLSEKIVIPRTKNGSEIGDGSMYGAAGWEKFKNAMRQQDVAKALQIAPNIDAKEAGQFAAWLKANTANLPDKEKYKFEREMIVRRLISARLQATSKTMAHWGDDHRLFGMPMKALERNQEMINGVTVHDRAHNIMMAVEDHDNAIRRVTPEAAKMFVDGYHPRSGAFSKEATLKERFSGGLTAEKLNREGGSGVLPGGKRVYNSIHEAEMAGEKVDPKFDPRLPLQKGMTKSQRLLAYANFLKGYAKPINYAQTIRDAAAAGYIDTPIAKIDPGMQYKDFKKWQDLEAKYQMDKALGTKMDSSKMSTLQEDTEDRRTGLYNKIKESYEAYHPGMTFDTEAQTGLADMAGYSVPHWARDAAVDSHPAFDAKGSPRDRTTMISTDPPENALATSVESMSNVFRTLFMADPTYHQRANLSDILFELGGLNPLEIQQILFAPNTIDHALLSRAEKYGATTHSGHYGVGGAKEQVRNAYAGINTPIERNLVKRQMALPDRLKAVLKASAKAREGESSWGGNFMHTLSHAMYTMDKWNSDFTFKVYEDVSAAMLFGKLEKKLGDPRAAARETRRMLGDSTNNTRFERKLGLHNFVWFYNWTKGQFRLAARRMTNPKVLATHGAIMGALNAQDQSEEGADNEAALGDLVFHVGDKQYEIGATPGPWGKMMSLNALVAAPVSGYGASAQDFTKYAVNDAIYSATPGIKMLYQAAMTATQGDNDNKGAFYGGSMPPEIQRQQLGQSLGGDIAPTQAQAITGGIADPVKLLGLLGRPVRPFGGSSIADAILLKQYNKLLQNRLHAPDASYQDKADAKEEYGQTRLDLMKDEQEQRGY